MGRLSGNGGGIGFGNGEGTGFGNGLGVYVSEPARPSGVGIGCTIGIADAVLGRISE